MSEEVKSNEESQKAEDKSVQSEVVGLSNKDIKYRARYKETVAELEQLKASAERKEKQIEEKISSIEKQKNLAIQKRIDAELKAASFNAGLNDPDLIKLMDKEKISIDENGDPIGIESVVEEFKAKKPAYFSEPKKFSSSTNAEPVKPTVPVRKSAWELSDQEFAKETNRLLRNY